MKGKAPFNVETLINKTNLPFSLTIMSCTIPQKFRIPQMETFDGSQDAFDHLETYKTLMLLYDYSDGIMCRAFPATLKGLVGKWFDSLKGGKH